MIKTGKRLIVVKSDIYLIKDEKEKMVATMLGTMVPSIVSS